MSRTFTTWSSGARTSHAYLAHVCQNEDLLTATSRSTPPCCDQNLQHDISP